MKVCIVTVYNSENCGSFLQANALQLYLKQLGHEVFFLERKDSMSSRSLHYRLLENFKCFLRGNIQQVRLNVLRHNNFNNLLSCYNIVDLKRTDDVDLFLIGSDTIWNFHDDYFRKNVSIYTGEVFPKNKFIIYAASSANVTASEVKKYGINMIPLCSALALSVRDIGTQNMVRETVRLNPSLVCDPTLLFSAEDYNKWLGPVASPLKDKYLLIYHFGIINKVYQKRIRMFAKEKKYKVVSIGSAISWADSSVPASPHDFLLYFRFAEYVITNTYHGTVFSTIFNKNFIVLSTSKNKVIDYLERLGLFNRISQTPEDFSIIIKKDITYSKVNTQIKLLKQCSVLFLEQAINCYNIAPKLSENPDCNDTPEIVHNHVSNHPIFGKKSH